MTATARKLMLDLYGRDLWAEVTAAAPMREPDLQGWNGNHPVFRRLLAGRERPAVVIDVGVWKGQSTITMARAIRENALDGCVIAVDTFLGSPEHWFEEGALYRRNAGRPDLYERFLGNVVGEGLQDYVVPLPQTSTAAAAILESAGIAASLIHIDASHAYEDVLRDARAFWKLVEIGGCLVGDDYDPSWPGVIRAAGEFSQAVGRPIEIAYPKWIVKKTGADDPSARSAEPAGLPPIF
jgi:hypothetical protein